ncbi:hypothetical protein QW131_31975 [Roseibium salinum]|nr:hypothetical protein [Roseibium salinum]
MDAVSGGAINIDGHGFEDGDAVTYIGPESYQVSRDAVDLWFEFEDGEIVLAENPIGNLIALASETSLNGTRLTYLASSTSTVEFDSNQVLAVEEDNPFIVTDSINEDIIQITGHGFITGTALTYHAGTTPIGGLVDGETYYVVVATQDKFWLAASREDAFEYVNTVALFRDARLTLDLADPGEGTHSFTYANTISGLLDGATYTVSSSPVDIDTDAGTKEIELYQLKLNGQTVEISRDGMIDSEFHNFYRDGDFPIRELENGRTYYVQKVDDDSFRLLEAPDATDYIHLSDPEYDGSQTIARLGIDFQSTGSSIGKLVIDLSVDPNNTDLPTLHGTYLPPNIYVPLEDIASFAGDGQSSAETQGFGLSVAGSNANRSDLLFNSTVITSIADASLTTTGPGHIKLYSDVSTAGFTYSSTFAINLLGGSKESKSYVDVNGTTRVEVGEGAVITAGGDILLETHSKHDWHANGRSEGGGFIDFAFTYSQSFVDEENLIAIGADAKLVADGTIATDAVSTGVGKAEAFVSNGGFGAGASSQRGGGEGEDGARYTLDTRVTIGEKCSSGRKCT